MFARRGVLFAGSILFYLLFMIVAAVSMAACGIDPPLPASGFTWPVDGSVSRSWSLDCATSRGHRGIDIEANAGDAVHAAAAGVVSFVGYTPAEGGGTTVCIDHEGGLRTTYLHLAGAVVRKGEQVEQGQDLGVSDGAPLHFGMKSAMAATETYYDPLGLLPAPASTPTETPPQDMPAGDLETQTDQPPADGRDNVTTSPVMLQEAAPFTSATGTEPSMVATSSHAAAQADEADLQPDIAPTGNPSPKVPDIFGETPAAMVAPESNSGFSALPALPTFNTPAFLASGKQHGIEMPAMPERLSGQRAAIVAAALLLVSVVASGAAGGIGGIIDPGWRATASPA